MILQIIVIGFLAVAALFTLAFVVVFACLGLDSFMSARKLPKESAMRAIHSKDARIDLGLLLLCGVGVFAFIRAIISIAGESW